jgi:hypothetical protein
MKKICFIADSIFKSAGMQRVTAVLAEELTKYYDVTIVTFEDPQQKDLKMLRAGIKAEFNSHMDQ